MKYIKGTNYGSKILSDETIEEIEETWHFEHMGTEVIKDRSLRDLPTIYVGGFLGCDNDGIIYFPFVHPDEDKFDYSVCEIFMKREAGDI